MKTCPSCSTEIADNARRCPKGGHTFTTAGGVFVAVIIGLVLAAVVFGLL